MTQRIRAGAVIFARDVARLAAFYARLVPMMPAGEEDGAVFLENDVLQLIIHPLPPGVAEQGAIATPRAPRWRSAVKLVLPVDSLARVRAQAAALGGGMKDAAAAFTCRDFRACDGHDPEGNIIQFREALTAGEGPSPAA